jgi:hypothetical protein
MKNLTISALVLALGSTMMAAPQGGAPKKASTAPSTIPVLGADAKATVAKEGVKAKTKVKKAAKDKVSHDGHK